METYERGYDPPWGCHRGTYLFMVESHPSTYIGDVESPKYHVVSRSKTSL